MITLRGDSLRGSRHEALAKVKKTFEERAQRPYAVYLQYMKETDKVKIEEIVERLRQIQQPQDYKPDSKMCDYLDRSMYADYFRSYIRELVRAFEAEHAKMQLFVATGARVNCAIWGIMVGRNGAVKDFLIECTKITMVDFFCRISKGDLYVICNDTFRDAVLCNPALRQRFEEINDAIQEKVAQSP